jgi:DNA-binding CsgD family transcriptional regulator
MNDSVLEASLRDSDLAVCVKDTDKTVLMQNDRCRDICGSRMDQVCRFGCMQLYSADTSRQWKDWGSRTYHNSLINDHYYDVTLLCTSRHIISFLQALDEKYQAAMTYYQGQDLTPRELEVTSLTIRGISNAEICERLSISRATLKTHLNHVYGKLRDRNESPDFIPVNRVPTCS